MDGDAGMRLWSLAHSCVLWGGTSLKSHVTAHTSETRECLGRPSLIQIHRTPFTVTEGLSRERETGPPLSRGQPRVLAATRTRTRTRA